MAPKYTIEELRALRAKIDSIRRRMKNSGGRWTCPDCCNVFDVKPKQGRCTECGTKVVDTEENPRQKGDDDGVEYGDPRDARREL